MSAISNSYSGSITVYTTPPEGNEYSMGLPLELVRRLFSFFDFQSLLFYRTKSPLLFVLATDALLTRKFTVFAPEKFYWDYLINTENVELISRNFDCIIKIVVTMNLSLRDYLYTTSEGEDRNKPKDLMRLGLKQNNLYSSLQGMKHLLCTPPLLTASHSVAHLDESLFPLFTDLVEQLGALRLQEAIDIIKKVIPSPLLPSVCRIFLQCIENFPTPLNAVQHNIININLELLKAMKSFDNIIKREIEETKYAFVRFLSGIEDILNLACCENLVILLNKSINATPFDPPVASTQANLFSFCKSETITLLKNLLSLLTFWITPGSSLYDCYLGLGSRIIQELEHQPFRNRPFHDVIACYQSLPEATKRSYDATLKIKADRLLPDHITTAEAMDFDRWNRAITFSALLIDAEFKLTFNKKIAALLNREYLNTFLPQITKELAQMLIPICYKQGWLLEAKVLLEILKDDPDYETFHNIVTCMHNSAIWKIKIDEYLAKDNAELVQDYIDTLPKLAHKQLLAYFFEQQAEIELRPKTSPSFDEIEEIEMDEDFYIEEEEIDLDTE